MSKHKTLNVAKEYQTREERDGMEEKVHINHLKAETTSCLQDRELVETVPNENLIYDDEADK